MGRIIVKARNAMLILSFLVIRSLVFAGGSLEGSSTGTAKYHAGRGYILRPEQVVTSSFISSIDYTYPEPIGLFGISAYSGNKVISATPGSDQVFVIGLQGARLPMEKLPPLNLCFVIDCSGSMSGEKIQWVKDSFDVFLKTVRDTDFVSLVKFNNSATIVFPSTKMSGAAVRSEFRDAVGEIVSGGGTNLVAGLKTGYGQVMANYRKEYANKVLFLTDGQGGEDGMLEMAKSFAEMNINVSTIGLGVGFNEKLLSDVAKAGSGTSRFIADRETMLEVFGVGLSRMVVPLVRDLEISVRLPSGTKIMGSWGYDCVPDNNIVTCKYPVLHVGDYETIVIKASLPKFESIGVNSVLDISGIYLDFDGKQRRIPDQSMAVHVVESGKETDGYSDAKVLRIGTVLNYAEGLKQIGSLYYSDQDRMTTGEAKTDSIEKRTDALRIANTLKKELYSAEERLESEEFSDEIGLIEQYIHILGVDLDYPEEKIAELLGDRESAVRSSEQSFSERVAGLFLELSMCLTAQGKGPMVVSGFSFKDNRKTPILDFLTSCAETSFTNNTDFPVVAGHDLDKILSEQELTLSGLFETDNAIAVGKLLSARYMITGTVMEMPSSVIVFTRIIDIESSEILGATQIIVNKDKDISAMLRSN
ncbi:MAG: hypothetical protein A2413_01205 [Treponema sp. RIFOXYC1_FULL_61_9]|nr:MAG: hypothetical protein A2413_01205 [Treponema sp. RIFOXYC1_FULL_61_9]